MELSEDELRIIGRYMQCTAECRPNPESPTELRVYLGPGDSAASLSIDGARKILAEISNGRLQIGARDRLRYAAFAGR
jgi:hypothetical protein